MNVLRKIGKRKIMFSRVRRRIMRHIWIMRGAFLALILVVVGLLVLLLNLIFQDTEIGRYFSLGRDFIFATPESVGAFDGRINVLVLGKAGEGHPAPELTDTMILASISSKQDKIRMISLPRDIWIPELRVKLNSVYFWGNQKQEGGGNVLAKSSVEEILGEPIHYVAIIDFSGFEDLIDVIGGVEVDVAKGFVDNRFPIAGAENLDCGGDIEFNCRYETVEFVAGMQYMDGARALKFVRSRMSEDIEEGTDLARGARQQVVLAAIKNKILSADFLTSPRRLLGVFRTIESIVETDIDDRSLAVIGRRVYESKDNVSSSVLPEEFIFNPPPTPKYDNLYVFLPVDGGWESVHEWVDGVLAGD